MGFFSKIGRAFKKAGHWVGDTAKKVGRGIQHGAKKVGRFLKGAAKVAKKIIDGIKYAIARVRRIPIIGKALKSLYDKYGDKMLPIGVSLKQIVGIADQIPSALDSAGDISNIIGNVNVKSDLDVAMAVYRSKRKIEAIKGNVKTVGQIADSGTSGKLNFKDATKDLGKNLSAEYKAL